MTSTPDPFVEHSLRTSLFFPQTRLFVAGNPKAAGTSLRWWLLEAHGVDVAAATAESLWGESAPFQAVWDGAVDLRFTWDRLSVAEREDALTATDVVTVQPVRHPVTRAFSAWAGKYLTAEPYYAERLPPGFPDLPERVASEAQIRELFTGFVTALAAHVADSGSWSGVDVHFWPQGRLLARPVAGQSLVLRQEELAEGLRRIEDQLRQHGVEVEPMPRVNENVVSYRPDLVDPSAVEQLAGIYSDDFAVWDYPADAPTAGSRPVDLDWLNDVRGRNRRYGVVHRAATSERRRAERAEQELADARRREAELTSSHSWRVTRPLRWASEHARRR
ncbi:MAG: sulfotransferase family protein [Actinomycetota bacterium]|nr:sulfotransferase family protein [Actinomycetota bacterium]